MSSSWVREIRPAALERAHFECQHCGARSGLDVHHMDLNPTHNDLDNLIVLCRQCHAEVHRRRSATWPVA